MQNEEDCLSYIFNTIHSECLRGEDYVRKFQKIFLCDMQLCKFYRLQKRWGEVYSLLTEHDNQYRTLPKILQDKLDFFLMASIKFMILESCFELERYKEGGNLGKLFLQKIEEKKIMEEFDMQSKYMFNMTHQEQHSVNYAKKKIHVTPMEQLENILTLKGQCHYLLYKYQLRKNQFPKAIQQLECTIEVSKKLNGIDHVLSVRYMKEMEKLIKKQKFEGYLRNEINDYSTFQAGMLGEKRKLLRVKPPAPTQLDQSIPQQSQVKSIYLTPTYVELVRLTSLLSKVDVDRDKKDSLFRINKVIKKPEQQKLALPEQQLQRQLAISIHSFESKQVNGNVNGEEVQNIIILEKKKNQFLQNLDEVQIFKPQFEQMMLKRPQSAVLLRVKNPVPQKLKFEDPLDNKPLNQRVFQHPRRSTMMKANNKNVRGPKAKKIIEITAVETHEKSIQVDTYEMFRSSVKSIKTKVNLDTSILQDKSLDEFSSNKEMVINELKKNRIDYDILKIKLRTLVDEREFNAVNFIKRFIKRRNIRIRNKKKREGRLGGYYIKQIQLE